MSTATLCGIDVLTFWELTPRELTICVNSYSENKKQAQEGNLTLVYLNNAWNPYRCKTLPSLEKILGNENKKEDEMTAEEMLENIKKMNSVMGGTVY